MNRLAEVAGHAISCTNGACPTPRLFGYNLAIVYDQHSGHNAFRYLGERLFSQTIPVVTEWQLSGGSGKLIFQDSEGRRWTFLTDARFGRFESTKVYVNTNCHVSSQQVPSASDIRKTLHHVWDTVHEFVGHFHESVGGASG